MDTQYYAVYLDTCHKQNYGYPKIDKLILINRENVLECHT